MAKGKIILVGFGPGDGQHMSFRAREAIAESDVVIGYSTYIKLVEDLLDGKEVVRKGMTEEVDRCIKAYEQAKLGKTIALVSSGDIGVYGMAGPAYEVLFQAGWQPGDDIEVEVVPGSTALSACASLVGAPLTHDFCSISLSDLLTPWPVIANRLDAAARSDFVIALYNPKSGRRTQQIVEAQRILLQYRKPDTPVAIVKSAYRDLQDIRMVTLESLTDCKIGMLTTVLIGNSTTYMQAGMMITPRGYANKYDDLTGTVKEGEKAGRSLSMGLLGWKECVRKVLRDSETHSLREIAHHFNMPVADILGAISEATDDDNAGTYKAVAVHPDQLARVLDFAGEWGHLRAVVRSKTGAVSKLMLHADDFFVKGDWLNIENDHYHLHINWRQVQQAWLVSRGENLRSVQFLDNKGDTVFNLSLLRKQGAFEAGTAQAFDTAWNILSTTNQLEMASNE